jgi:tetratricopeptide (TPR) repeat protein
LASNNLIYELRWEEAEKHYKRALELDPGNSTAYQWYGDYLYMIGRLKDAIPQLERAVKIDPLSAVMQNDLGQTYNMAGRNAEAQAMLKRGIEIDSTFLFTRANLAGTYMSQGKLDSALAMLGGDPLSAIMRIRVLEMLNRKEEAKREFERVRASLPPGGVNGAMALAYIHGAAYNADSAFIWLNKAIDARDGSLFSSSVPCFGVFEFMQKDPRWDQTLARMKVGRCQR